MNTLLSIMTMFQYDPTLFEDLVLPDGVDEDLVTDQILMDLGELELLYNDPSFMKFAIGRWSAKELEKWENQFATTKLDYNPIENYNRTEDTLLTETRDLTQTNDETRDLVGSNLETRDLAGSNNETKDLAGSTLETRDLATSIIGATDTTDTDVSSGGDSSTTSKAGYNSGTTQTSEVVSTSLGSTNTKNVDTDTTQDGTDTGTVNMATTDTGTDNTTITDTGTVNNASTDAGTVNNASTDAGTVTNQTSSNIKGNIGVTTSQQMIEQERKVNEFCIYDYITESFKKRFCIMVW